MSGLRRKTRTEHHSKSLFAAKSIRTSVGLGLYLLVAPHAMAAPGAASGSSQAISLPVEDFGRVSFDKRSLMIDGKRLIVWSGEFHPFRLPSPDLWRDILQKMKATGFNTVAIYFDWSYHSPKPGEYDFAGIRDVDRLLAMAKEEGLYVITRAGPYVNAELSRGGFPGWLVNQRARARTDDPEYLAAADEWMSRVQRIIARHQINGDGKGNRGTVILHQIENELALTTPAQRRYMDHLFARARADGITVPIFHNDQGRNGYWVPEPEAVAKTVPGPVDLYAFDGYPGGTCTATGKVTRGSAAPDWGFYGSGGARGGASASPATPGFLAEYGGGWFDYWGSNGGYECNALQRGKRFQRVFYGTNLANGITLQSIYMVYGGTSWGWQPAPVVFTSYDYGAAISEPREIREKALEMKALGGLIAAVPDLAGMVPAPPLAIGNDKIQVYHNRNPESDARFLMVTHRPSNGNGDDRFTLSLDLRDGHYDLPGMQLSGFDAKWLVAGVDLGGQRLVYSTSELQSHLAVGDRDIVLLYGRTAERGETVLRYRSEPAVQVLSGKVEARFDPDRQDLKLAYDYTASARVLIRGGGRRPLLLLLGDEAEAARHWRTAAGSDSAVMTRGPALVRTAQIAGSTLLLTGDTAKASPLEIWASPEIKLLRWNGIAVPVIRTASGSLLAKTELPGPQPLALPVLKAWRFAVGTPEARPAFDDSSWQAIDRRAYASITQRPDGEPNMSMDAYGFHEGDVWYRGQFANAGGARSLTLQYGGGGAGMMQVFLDGKLLGQHELPGGMPRPITTASVTLPLPADLGTAAHVLAVMVRNNGHNWDLDADDFHKEARGLIAASITGSDGRNFAVPVAWKIQGRAGGEDFADRTRGVPNNGGQFGEREGWHLPGFDDSAWQAATTPETRATSPGTNWYRTRFRLNVPREQDATIGIAFGDIAVPRSNVAYRATLFVNGWNMGQFVANIGPQRVFPVPEGILDHRGENVLALAVTTDGQSRNALEEVRLIAMRNVRGGVPVRNVPAPARLQDMESTK